MKNTWLTQLTVATAAALSFATVHAQNQAPLPEVAPAPAPVHQPLAGQAPLPDQVVITVDGSPITESDLRERFMARYARQFQQIPPEQQAQAKLEIQQMIVSELVQQALLLNQANRDKMPASDEEIAEMTKRITDSLPEGRTIEEYAQSTGRSLPELREMIADEIKIEHLLDGVTKDITAPSEEEAKAFYDGNPEKFDKPETVKARHILVSTEEITDEAQLSARKAEAEKIRADLIAAKGENFAEVARAKSEGPSGKNGGDLGEFGRGQMVPEFDAAAFTQEIGVIGEVVESKFGYHIIQVQERNPARKLAYEEVKEKLTAGMLAERRREKIGEYLKELQSKADIKQTPPAPASP